MAHTLDSYEPTPADVIHIQQKALDEKVQTIRRLRAVNASLLAACEAVLDFASIRQSIDWRCRFCGEIDYHWESIAHANWCVVPTVQQAIHKAQGEDGP